MIRVTSTAKDFAPYLVRKRYVRALGDGRYFWCEVGDDRTVDLRQGLCSARDLNPTLRAAAEARRGYFPSYVEWPRA